MTGTSRSLTNLAVLWAWLIAYLEPSTPAIAKDWAIAGTVVTPGQIVADGAVTISDQKISAIGTVSSVASGVPMERIDGIVLPGLIDLHDHLTWNILPRWTPNHKFSNRYEWQDTAEYDRVLAAPHALALAGAACESEIFAEVKAIMGGATSVVGSLLPDKAHPENKVCAQGLARNLDVASDLGVTTLSNDPCELSFPGSQPPLDVIDYEVFPMELARDRMGFLQCELKSGALRALVVHLSEGAPFDASARREFKMLSSTGLVTPGLILVHGTALRADDFQSLKGAAGLVWSPRSNDELYGASTNIAAAMQANISVAIAPDWSPTGGAGMLQELGYAARRYKNVSAAQLVSMGTAVPAKMSRLDDRIGSLTPGLFADLLVLRGDRSNPYQAVVQATPADVLLVIVGGQPLYGDRALLARLLPGAHLELVKVCGAPKALYLGNSAAADRRETLANISAVLDVALERSGSKLAAFECD